MGNARGNYNSRRHITLDPDHIIQKFSFFDFTFEEIAIIDLPTMMDYALEYTGNQQLYYVGHSQGGTVFLILMSMKPEYNKKIASAHLMAGVGYMKYFPDGQLKTAARFVDTIYVSSMNYLLCTRIYNCRVTFLHTMDLKNLADFQVDVMINLHSTENNLYILNIFFSTY